MYGRGLRSLSLATVAVLAAALALVFFYAPLDADQGFVQKIFYIHVPLAIVSLCGFIAAGVMAIQHLRTRDSRWDMRAYVSIHLSLILAVAVLITGSIWARASWGHWWVWNEPTLVSYLIIFLLYATYQPLRFSIEDSERQARYASVFAITRTPLVPLSRRCTSPGRARRPSPGSTWCIKPLSKVPVQWPGPGCITRPGGLSITRSAESSCRTRSAPPQALVCALLS